MCQKSKITGQLKYGKLLADNRTRDIPWKTVHVDLIGPWKVSVKYEDGKTKEHQIQALTCIDAATDFCEIIAIRNKASDYISMKFDNHFLCRYPRPVEVVYDQGSEFKSEFSELLLSYGIKPIPTTVKNPTANAIIERTHLTMGDMLRGKEFQVSNNWTWHDEVDCTLQSVAWALRSTVSATIKRSPGQLAFNRDMIMNMQIHSNWKNIAETRRRQTIADNIRENDNRIEHDYKIYDQVLVKLNAFERRNQRKIGDAPTRGPYTIIQKYSNGTVRIKKGNYEETISIRRVKPFQT